MEDYSRSKSHSRNYDYNNNNFYNHKSRSYSYNYDYNNTNYKNNMEIVNYQQPTSFSSSYDLRSYSVSHAQTQMTNYNKDRDFQLKKGKSVSGSTSKSSSWGLADPEFQRKKRLAGYKMYGVEGKVKGSFSRTFRWIKSRYSQVVHGWW